MKIKITYRLVLISLSTLWLAGATGIACYVVVL